jgi:hypothetical protein
MSKRLILDGVTTDTTTDPIEPAPGEVGLFIVLNSVGHGRFTMQSSSDGGLSWVNCKEIDGSDAIFTSSGFHELFNHGGNTLLRVIVDKTDGSTTPISAYLTTI